MAREVEIKKFGNPIKGIQEGIAKGNIAIAGNVTTQAKLLAPVKEGRLRNSIMWKVPTEKGGFNDSGGEKADNEITVNPKVNEGYVGSNLDYSIYQEFGTRKMKPQPYLRPAIDIVVNRTDTKTVLAKIQEEEMKGPLKEGQTRVRF